MTQKQLAAIVRGIVPVVRAHVAKQHQETLARLAVAEAQLAAVTSRVQDDAFTKELGTLRERVAVLAAKEGVPGPPGKDGADGLGFEDLDVSLSGDRTLVFRFARGDQEKTFRVDVGWPVYQKNWIQGKAYVPGDVVTWDGGQWQCLTATDADVPGLSQAWYKSVTKGRAGAPGRDGKDWAPPPVVSVGGQR